MKSQLNFLAAPLSATNPIPSRKIVDGSGTLWVGGVSSVAPRLPVKLKRAPRR
jgi:hypothetical protein